MPYHYPPLDISKWVPGIPIKRERRPKVVAKPLIIRSPVPAASPAPAEPATTQPAQKPHTGRPPASCSVQDVVNVFLSDPSRTYRSGELAMAVMAATGVKSRTAAMRWVRLAEAQGRIVKKNRVWILHPSG
jgi:hypothetical protein